MSETSEAAVPPMVRQGELIEEISAMLPERVEGEWKRLIFRRRALSMYGEEEMDVLRPDGSEDWAYTPIRTKKLFDELRNVMYRPDAGTWISVEWTIDNDGGTPTASVAFNYDSQPEWDSDIDPGLYGLDLDKFPRRDDAIPGWMKAKVAEARARAPRQ